MKTATTRSTSMNHVTRARVSARPCRCVLGRVARPFVGAWRLIDSIELLMDFIGLRSLRGRASPGATLPRDLTHGLTHDLTDTSVAANHAELVGDPIDHECGLFLLASSVSVPVLDSGSMPPQPRHSFRGKIPPSVYVTP